MGLLDSFNKPEYFFRPRQLVRRFSARPRDINQRVVVVMPWGKQLLIRPAETVGASIWNAGVYDLAVTEVLWRLSQAGDLAVDAGANIGCYTSLLASRVGPTGTVFAYEPHPAVFQDLKENVELWSSQPGNVRLRNVALSDNAGKAVLSQPDGFSGNRGGSHVGHGKGGSQFQVDVAKLDDELGSYGSLGLLKIDVEGHEPALLDGASSLLRRKQIRDVVYEEHSAQLGAASRILQEHGYKLFRILRQFFGPSLTDASYRREQAHMPSSYLATTDAERAAKRLSPRGWHCLKAHPS